MIDQNRISGNWISKISEQNQIVDPTLVEKVIRAFLLLEGLAKHGLNFTFKGGTSLMLHFKSPKRLSIDIDIITQSTIEEVRQVLGKLMDSQGFSHFLENKRADKASTLISKAHFKCFYTPTYKSNKELDFVILDVLFEESMYESTLNLPVASVFVPQLSHPILVKAPSLEDLLGDKLTAFAPNTTGIPYLKNDQGMGMEIIKQLYDIGNLFDVAQDLSIVRNTFLKNAKIELGYRNLLELGSAQVMQDVFQTALCISSRGLYGNGDFEELQRGIQRIKSFIFSERFHIENAIITSAKVAYLITLVDSNKVHIARYSNPLIMKSWEIKDSSFLRLNKLKKSNPEAFFYWVKTLELRVL